MGVEGLGDGGVAFVQRSQGGELRARVTATDVVGAVPVEIYLWSSADRLLERLDSLDPTGR